MNIVNYILNTYYGLKEVEGPGYSPTILRWVNKYFPDVKDDETIPNCSICLRECFKELGLGEEIKTTTPAASSWLSVGDSIDLEEAESGDIVVLKRKGGNHVGLFIRFSPVQNVIYLLGFNQNNQCNITGYNISLLKGIRRIYGNDKI